MIQRTQIPYDMWSHVSSCPDVWKWIFWKSWGFFFPFQTQGEVDDIINYWLFEGDWCLFVMFVFFSFLLFAKRQKWYVVKEKPSMAIFASQTVSLKNIHTTKDSKRIWLFFCYRKINLEKPSGIQLWSCQSEAVFVSQVWWSDFSQGYRMAALWKGLVAHEVSVPRNFKKWFVEFERCTVNFVWSKSVCDSIQVAVFLGLKCTPVTSYQGGSPSLCLSQVWPKISKMMTAILGPSAVGTGSGGCFWAEAESKWMETLGKCKSNSGTLMHFQACFTTSKHFPSIFPQQQNLHNIDFGVFWASWGGSGKEPGSGNRFQEPVLGTGSGFRWVPTGFAVPRLRFRRLRERGFEGFGVWWVPRG